MFKSWLCESLASVLALGGALMLGITFFPILNPTQYKMNVSADPAPLSRYLRRLRRIQKEKRRVRRMIG
jgi:hypothetical protein